MLTASIIASAVLTIIVLILSLITIQKGYGYKHTVDPPTSGADDERANESEQQD